MRIADTTHVGFPLNVLASLAACLLAGVSGCGGDAIDRLAVSGEVTLDGRPLDDASITLVPIGPGPSAGAEISAGNFTIERSVGPSPGKYRVEIRAYRGTGRQIPDDDAPGQMIEATEPIIPGRYNRDTELEVEVTVDGENHFQFALLMMRNRP